jgi:hypothetical protein
MSFRELAGVIAPRGLPALMAISLAAALIPDKWLQ